jgi:hypothetical protein
MNVRLIVIRLKLIDIERDFEKVNDNELQMSKGSRKTTLGDLQGDQSEV